MKFKLRADSASNRKLSIETAADGLGSVMTAPTLNDGAAVTLYAVYRDTTGKFISNATDATWSASALTGYFAPSAGSSTVFTPNGRAGSTTITVSGGGLTASLSSVNLTYSVQALGSLAFWVKAESLIELSEGASVAKWPDSSAASADAVQSNAPEMPKLYHSVVNGRPTLRFDGVQSKLSFPGTIAVGTNYSIFVVGARATGAHENMFIGGTTAGTRQNLAFGFRQDSGGFMPLTFNLAHYGNDVWGTSTAFSSKVFELWEGLFSTANGKRIYRKGTLFATNASNNQTLTDGSGTMIGYWPLLSVGFEGDISEILFYQRELSPAERATVESYLISKYNL